ncbi:MAG: DTW domain-containing protein [Myxococcales bacterium]|nr:DTW domain-containing protein [Myxococcales bacterium]
MHADRCICAAIPAIETRTRVVLVMHHRELKKTTNTGTLAQKALVNSAIVTWGHPEEAHDDTLLAVPPGRRGLVLSPAADALPLDAALAAADPRPVTLFVPDGSWRQAMKIPRRLPALADLPRVTLAAGAPTAYHLREEVRSFGLATIEAIARALGVLDGPAAQAALEAVFDAMVAATLATRGRAVPDA